MHAGPDRFGASSMMGAGFFLGESGRTLVPTIHPFRCQGCQWVGYVHHIYTTYTPYIHHVYTIYTPYTHHIYTIYTPYIHHIYTIYTSLSPLFLHRHEWGGLCFHLRLIGSLKLYRQVKRSNVTSGVKRNEMALASIKVLQSRGFFLGCGAGTQRGSWPPHS